MSGPLQSGEQNAETNSTRLARLYLACKKPGSDDLEKIVAARVARIPVRILATRRKGRRSGWPDWWYMNWVRLWPDCHWFLQMLETFK